MSRSGSMILCYHRVAREPEDPFNLCVAPENFAAHIDEIVRHGEPSTLAEFALPSRRPRVVVTLDDGYADNLTNALPIAEARGVPITVFVASGNVDGEQGFWWDRLGSLLRSRPAEIHEMVLPLADGPVRIALGTPDDLGSVRSHLLPLPVTEIHRILDVVAEEWGTPASPTPGARTLTSSELLELAASELVTIGAHTVDHVRLSNLPAREQEENISSSKQTLEGLIGRPVTHFAYPFGGTDSFNGDSVEAVRSSGFETACTTVPANARPTSHPFELPRRMVMNWSGLRFRASLERWKLVTRR